MIWTTTAASFDFGFDYRNSKMKQAAINTQQDLGSWGISNPRDVQQYAGSLVKQFCMSCRFDDFDLKHSGAGLVAFRADAIDLYNALSKPYVALGNAVGVTSQDDNRVEEDIWGVYGQLTWKGELAGRRGQHGRRRALRGNQVGLRVADPHAAGHRLDRRQRLPRRHRATYRPSRARTKYTNLLPALDFQVELVEDVVARFSFSRTIARPDYGNLFASVSAQAPNRPIANGAIALGTRGNPELQPLISDNFDVSVEWYYKPSSYHFGRLLREAREQLRGHGHLQPEPVRSA